MICYRKACNRKEECDRLVMATCLYRIDKKQAELKIKINKSICKSCFTTMVKARYRNKDIMLCTTCNNVLKELRQRMSKGA